MMQYVHGKDQHDRIKYELRAKVDHQAGDLRLKFITDVPGQSMVYQQKRVEAELIAANPSINPYEVPHLYAESQMNDETLLQTASRVLMMANQWLFVSSFIESKRIKHLQLIKDALTIYEAQGYVNVDWSALDPYL